MDKIKKSFMLVDKLLNEEENCGCTDDQIDVAFQKDTLFDDPERIVKDRTDEEPSLNPVPNTENIKRILKKIVKETMFGPGADDAEEGPEKSQDYNKVAQMRADQLRKAASGHASSKEFDQRRDVQRMGHQTHREGLMDVFSSKKPEDNKPANPVEKTRDSVQQGTYKGSGFLGQQSEKNKQLAAIMAERKQTLKEIEPISILAAGAGSIAGVALGTYMVKKQCEKLYPDDLEKQKKCRNSPAWKRKDL